MDEKHNVLESPDIDSVKNTILKPSLGDNLIILQTPIHKNLKVHFQTPSRTPLSLLQHTTNVNLPIITKPAELLAIDEEDCWKERIEVLTKCDHEDYINSAQQFIEEIVQFVVDRCNRQETLNSKSISHGNSENFAIQKNIPQTNSEVENKENIFYPNGDSKRHSIDTAYDMKRSSISITTGSNLQHEQSGHFASTTNTFSGSFDFDSNHLYPKKNKSPDQSEFKTVFSVFETERIPSTNEILLDSDRTVKYIEKSSPNSKPSKPNISRTSTSPQRRGSLYCTRKVVAARTPSPEKPPAEPNLRKHFVSAELHQKQNQSSFADEEFQDASALIERGFDFDLDYLATKGSGKASSDLRKQSLYLKFDPLVAGESPARTRVPPARKSDIIDLTGQAELPHFTEEPNKKTVSSPKRDLLCSSPIVYAKVAGSPEAKAVNRVMKSSSKESWVSAKAHLGDSEEIVELLKYSEADVEKIKEPLLNQIAALNKEAATQREKINQMQVVLEEYESTVFEMAQKCDDEKSKLEIEKSEIVAEQEKTVSHLESVEKAYLELLQRSEQMKIGINNYKVNEDTYKSVIAEYQTAQESFQQRYKALKATMEEEKASLMVEFEAERKDLRTQVTAAKARCKFLENQAKSLQLQLDQKTHENVELTKICDELIEQQQSPIAS